MNFIYEPTTTGGMQREYRAGYYGQGGANPANQQHFGYNIARTIIDDIGTSQAKRMTIKKVIFNEPATIVYWEDGCKTVVKCMEGDEFNPEIGLMTAYIKHLHTDVFGKTESYRAQFRPWIEEYNMKKAVDAAYVRLTSTARAVGNAFDKISRAFERFTNPR